MNAELIHITPQMERTAKRYAAEILERVQGRTNYTGLTEPRRYEIGYLGEFAVSSWLEQSGIAHTHEINTSGSSQPSEIVFEGRRFEVKTSNNPSSTDLMIPHAQPLDFDVVIGVRLHGVVAAILGWATRREVDQMEVRMTKILSRVHPYRSLRRPSRLIQICQEIQDDRD